MATVKSYTDLSQSKVLAEILPLESADMVYLRCDFEDEGEYSILVGSYHEGYTEREDGTIVPVFDEHIPAWSLSALLSVIPQVKLDSIKQYDKKCWRCCAYFASDWHNSDWCDNPVDACYEMILKLHELKVL